MTESAPAGFFNWRASPLLRFGFALCGRSERGGWPGRAARTIRHYCVANPIAVMEFRRALRGRRAPYFITMHLVMLGLFAFAAFNGMSRFGPFRFATTSNMYNTVTAGSPHAMLGQTLFGAVLTAELYALFLMLPGLAAYALPRERELRIASDLRATLLTPGQVIGGRVFVALGAALLLLLSAVPFLTAGFLTGGISSGHVAMTFMLLISFALAFTAIGLYCGSEFRSAGGAVVAAYLLSYLAAIFFIMEPRSLVRELLRQSEVIYALALVYLTGGALLIVAARERWAGWHERGRLLRPLIFASFLLIAVIFVVTEMRLLSANPMYSSFAATDLAILVFVVGLAHFFALALFGGRAPHPEQLRLPFFTAFDRAAREPLRENPLSLPVFLTGSYVIFLLPGLAGLALCGEFDLAIVTFFAGQAMLAGLLAYSGLALLIAFALRTPRFISGASFTATGIFLFIIFLYAVFRNNIWHYKFTWLSPVLLIPEYQRRAPDGDFLFDALFCLGLHLLLAYFTWRACYTLWQNRQWAGGYRLAGDDDHA